MGRSCSLWVHDDNLSREDVLLDLAIFPKDAVRPGDLVEVAVRRKILADEESVVPTVVPNIAHGANSRGARREGDLDSVTQDSAADGQHSGQSTAPNETSGYGRGVSERERSYVFVVKALSPELKQKYPNLQVSRPMPPPSYSSDCPSQADR